MPRLLYRCDKCKKLDFRPALPVQERGHPDCGGVWQPISLPFRAIEMLEEYERRIAALETRRSEALALALEIGHLLEAEKGATAEAVQALIILLRGEEE